MIRSSLIVAGIVAMLAAGAALLALGPGRGDAADLQGYKQCIRQCYAICQARTPQCARAKTQCMRGCSSFLK